MTIKKETVDVRCNKKRRRRKTKKQKVHLFYLLYCTEERITILRRIVQTSINKCIYCACSRDYEPYSLSEKKMMIIREPYLPQNKNQTMKVQK